MPSQITVTSSIGPGSTISSRVFTPITGLILDIARGVLTIQVQNQPSIDVSLSGITTFTDTISGGNHTVVAS